MIIEETILFKGDKGNDDLKVLFDSGAAISIVRRDKIKKLATFFKLPDPLVITLGDGVSKITFNQGIHLDFYLNGLRLWDEFYVADTLSDEVIFGVPTLQKWHIKLDFKHGKVITDPKVARMRL